MSGNYYKDIVLEFIGDCTNISPERSEQLMRGMVRADYKKVVRLIKRDEPSLHHDLALEFYNPYYAYRTNNHIILRHSSIEYFFKIRRLQ